MEELVVYDSFFGNTEQIARAIGDALGSPEKVGTLRVGEVQPEHLAGLRLLIVGSPTRQFRPSAAINDFIKRIPKNGLKGVEIAAFDTRLTESNIEETPVLSFFVKLFGYAAKPISEKLLRKGGVLLLPPEGFFVKDIEGPLIEGELDRAVEWGRQINAAREKVG